MPAVRLQCSSVLSKESYFLPLFLPVCPTRRFLFRKPPTEFKEVYEEHIEGFSGAASGKVGKKLGQKVRKEVGMQINNVDGDGRGGRRF